jgi:DNA processing protein
MMTRHRWDRGDRFPIPDAEYLPDMPRVLYGEGDRPDAFDAPCVAIVGTRAATPPGCSDARDIAAFCARAGLTVVSGLALGIDAAAHQGALDAGGLTVGVVATGLDRVYPAQHKRLYARVREQGLVVSEYESGVAPLPWRFPIRNRIIAALAKAVVVVEAGASGGALSTAKHAREFNRTLYVVPGSRRNPSSLGCNALLATGAIPLIDPSDVLAAFGRATAINGGWKPPVPPPQDPDQRKVLRAMAGEGVTIDDLRARCPLPGDRLGAALRELELSGRVTRRRGMWWPP